MTSTPSAVDIAAKTPRLFWWMLCIFTALALIPTAWPGIDLAAARVFDNHLQLTQARQWWWVELINLYIPALFRTLIVLALVTWVWATVRPSKKHWRVPLAFIVLAGALGPGLAVNLGFKDHWQRARPYQVQEFGGAQQFTRATVMTDQCNNNCSFVSGHVACGFFLVSMMLVQRKRKALWATSGVLAGLLIGFSRMADHAHWFSDVLWAGPITLLSSWIVWFFLLRVYKQDATDNSTTP